MIRIYFVFITSYLSNLFLYLLLIKVQEQRFQRKIKPIREPEHVHFLDESNFGFDAFPPFALGNFYLLSEDVARFLARNADDLRPVGTLEDVSVGFWLQSIQVCWLCTSPCS